MRYGDAQCFTSERVSQFLILNNDHQLRGRLAADLTAHVQLMEINRRVHKQNNVPKEFPLFVRNGYSIKVVADGYDVAPSGLMFKARLLDLLRSSLRYLKAQR